MALCCDLRIASEDAQFGVPEGTLGIIPAAGATQTLPRTVGRAKALEALLTSKRMDAQEAVRTGLVNRVVPREELLPCAEDMAKRIMSRRPVAMRITKRAIRRGLDMSLPAGLHMERHLYASAFDQASSATG
jgi:enoyl-CoA hydratase